MFTLYYKPSCAFSQRVLQMAENFNVTLELKDVSESAEAMSELIALGGKGEVPFLVDSERNVSMYESSDIIDHLREFGRQGSPVAVSRPRVHVGGSVCESCEG
ncbi:MAG: glutathione S-transferase N-terminal domain-containing protein [Candidatus Pacebacteria bacterium]|nr:glutathione S-transferase N-terminal domain-containing protein [Candidatus Paceibacterota bacterium]